MKIVFLDFDGPIIPLQSHKEKMGSGKAAQAWPPCVAALNRITETTGAKIVVSSTWRADGITRTRERLKEWGVTAPCIGLTPYMDERDTETGLWVSHPRGHEIQKFLDDCATVKSFVIIDDDRDMEHLLPRLVHTPFDIGLTEAHADRAIAMLK